MELETVPMQEPLQVEGFQPVIIADDDGNTTTFVAYTAQTTNDRDNQKTIAHASDGNTLKKKRARKYSEDLFLKFGFIPSPTNLDLPLCLLCERVFSNESMKTPRLREHLTKIHPDQAENDLKFFKGLKDKFYISKNMDENIKESDKINTKTYRGKKGYLNVSKQPKLMQFSNMLNPVKLKKLAKLWIDENASSFYFQGFTVENSVINVSIFCKEQSIFAGIPFVEAVCEEIGLKKLTWNYQEGEYLQNASPIDCIAVATIVGSAKQVFFAESIILNVLARCSGVATNCHRIRSILSWNGWSGQVIGSHKTTTPDIVEKYGLVVSGAGTPLHNMSSMGMLNKNLLKLTGNTLSMAELIVKTKKHAGFTCKIEVECNNLKEAMEAAQAGADVIMLDNFDPETAVQAAKEIKIAYSHVLIGASGSIHLDNAAKYATSEIDIISMSCLVQGYSVIDYSMKMNA